MVSKLNEVIRERLDEFMRRGCTVLVGDANGADKAVQMYFASRHYTKVVVFLHGAVPQQCGRMAGAQSTAADRKQGVQLLCRKGFRDGGRSAMRRDVVGREEQRNAAKHAEPDRRR